MVFAVEMSSEENIVTVSEVADLLHQQYAIITGKPKSDQKIEMSNNYYISLIYISYHTCTCWMFPIRSKLHFYH